MNPSTERHKVTKIKARTEEAQKPQKNLTQSGKGAKVKTDEPQPRTPKAFGGTVSGVNWTQIYADKQMYFTARSRRPQRNPTNHLSLSFLCAFASLREIFLRLLCVLCARLFNSTLVTHAQHRILHLIDQCAAHRDRNIAEQKQGQVSDVFGLDEPAPRHPRLSFG